MVKQLKGAAVFLENVSNFNWFKARRLFPLIGKHNKALFLAQQMIHYEMYQILCVDFAVKKQPGKLGFKRFLAFGLPNWRSSVQSLSRETRMLINVSVAAGMWNPHCGWALCSDATVH